MFATVEAEDSSVTINLRARRKQRALIDRGAELSGKSRTEFMLEAACRQAEEAMLDQRLFLLDEAAYNAFVAALERPVEPNHKLKALMARKPVWEK